MDLEELGQEAAAEYVLHLYITGATPNSTRAVQNIKGLCEQYLKGRYELVIIDIYQQPELAEQDQIVAAPTLVKKMPLPTRRLIGDLSEKDKVLLALGLSAPFGTASPHD
ncbi:circadian clock KaiB family protein [Hymenobacter sp. 5516J-16]|uniref:Circadian clock KaiB family protein n=1 Tax=Hymenobacter sublimis TaxID=2933777 RepID=A0ABY4JET6_9BACT|nr:MULTISPECIES: circadian clock KaiB family protein [Hymenobacter]UOQ76806.1 circadian clock KaiB family protein [Hymenobacter sp. 5516J-16]UPL50463.1 circadian clock KaiB family protein [Hymenobacter sublimis]